MLKRLLLNIIWIWIWLSIFANFNLLYFSSGGTPLIRVFNFKNTSNHPLTLNTQTLSGNKNFIIATGEIGSTELKWGQGFNEQNADFTLYKLERPILSYDDILRKIAFLREENYKYSDEVFISGNTSTKTDYQFFPIFFIKESLIVKYEVTVK